MPELKMTPEAGRELIWNGNKDFKKVSDEVYDTSRRWSEDREIIVQRLSDKTYWRSYYSVGKTEMQDEQAYEYDDAAVFHQVEQKEVVKTEWVTVEES